jgi:sugar phosphate isomerase/epimerase
MPFAICNEIFQGWKLEDAMSFAAKAGYDAIEIAPFTLNNYVTNIGAPERKEIVESAKRARIKIAGIHWVLAKTEGFHVTHPNAEVREKTSRYMCELVNFCADIGGHIIVFGSPKQRDVLEGVTPALAWDYAIKTFEPPVARALSRGVTICFEPLAPAETNFINTAAEAIRFVKCLRSASFKIILDAKAMSSESKPIPQIIAESKGQFAHFHANDKNLKGPGFGEVDFVPIAAALREANFQGYVSVEVFNFDEGTEAIATRSIEYLKKTFGRQSQ